VLDLTMQQLRWRRREQQHPIAP